MVMKVDRQCGWSVKLVLRMGIAIGVYTLPSASGTYIADQNM